WIIDGPIPLALAPTTMLAIAFAALVATALAYLLYWYILGLAGSGNLMLVTLLVPPVAITLGAVMRGESLPPQALIGFGFLALGLVVLDGRALGVLRRRQSN
ncbi:MAG TPA: EamA/RhaT family transporter, partial [Aliiroseovarius sp.]|nr:EamA/RhaT family transporter [Aliiroseovarius sp.]